METIKIEHSKKESKEVNIELPYYAKNLAHHYKVISQDKVISVSDSYIIKSTVNGCRAFEEGADKCTEEEFEEAFKNTVENFKNL